MFSVTSLQSNVITPANPRAIYFNEDTYVGYVPGGKIEVASFDPEIGAIFYIFPIPHGAELPVPERSQRCFNCHAGSFSHGVPGLFVESVIPGENGAPLDAYRRDQSGHAVPFHDRYGGWHVTGALNFPTKANLLGDYFRSKLTTRPNPPGALFRLQNYLVPTSDIVPHLLHEHQVGFVNRVINANYTAREKLASDHGSLSAANKAVLDEMAAALARYILFADEVKLPAPVTGDAGFIRDFMAGAKVARDGASLRELDLRTRLLKRRCSYMIGSTFWEEMHPLVKENVARLLWSSLQDESSDAISAHLPPDERRGIRRIIGETVRGLPAWWK